MLKDRRISSARSDSLLDCNIAGAIADLGAVPHSPELGVGEMNLVEFVSARRAAVFAALKAYLSLKTFSLLKLSETRRSPRGWETAVALAALICVINFIITSLATKGWGLDIKPIFFRVAGSAAAAGLYAAPVWLVIFLIRKRNYLLFISNLTLCQLATCISIVLSCCFIVLAGPVARTDLFLLREGKSAPTPIYDVACGNLNRHIDSLAELKELEYSLKKFEYNYNSYKFILASERNSSDNLNLKAANHLREAILWKKSIDRHVDRIVSIENNMRDAWSHLRKSYPSVAIAYWLSAVLFLSTFTVTLIHVARVIVCCSAQGRRGAATLMLIAALSTPFVIFGTYGAWRGYRDLKYPNETLLEKINAAHLEAEEKSIMCPKTSARGLW